MPLRSTELLMFLKKSIGRFCTFGLQNSCGKRPEVKLQFSMGHSTDNKATLSLMIDTFLDEAYVKTHKILPLIQNQLSRFMTEQEDVVFNDTLKKALLLRAQKSQDVFWNDFLSWLFIQQKEYGKAFIQQKAIYKRNPESFTNIVNLGQMAIEDNDQDSAQEILTFVLDNTKDLELLIQRIPIC